MAETIVLTASRGAFAGLAAALGPVSVAVEEHPLIRFEPPADWGALDTALAERHRFSCLALTSPRAAAAVVERMRRSGMRWGPESGPDVWVVGPGTATALEAAGVVVQLPRGQTDAGASAAATLAGAMLDSGVTGPVLFPCGERRRDELPAILRAQGIEVVEVVCYRTVLASRAQAGAAATRGTMVVVASPSVVQLLVDACVPDSRPRLIAVGPTTAASAQAAGWSPAAVAPEASTRGVASAIAALLAQP